MGRSAADHREAENQLLAVVITATGHRSEFGYDGLGRRVQIVEKAPDASKVLRVTSDKKYLWGGVEIAEERTGTDGGTVSKRFYAQPSRIMYEIQPKELRILVATPLAR